MSRPGANRVESGSAGYALKHPGQAAWAVVAENRRIEMRQHVTSRVFMLMSGVALAFALVGAGAQ